MHQKPGTVRTTKLGAADVELARRLFVLMAEVFEEQVENVSDVYVTRLLANPHFWVIAAFVADELVGGMTGHTLPMTRTESSEIFVYDIAVSANHQRQGVGRQLVTQLRAEAEAIGIRELFVAADNEDAHALDFYRALGGAASPVTMFSFRGSV